jgi:O-antigen ligase
VTAIDVRGGSRARRAIAPATRPPFLQRLDRPLPLVGWLFGHVVLGQVISTSPGLSRVYFLAASLLALNQVLRATTLDQALVSIFYILPIDVLWRMTGTIQPWEGGKYLTTFLCLLIVARFRGSTRRAGLPALFIVVLLPALYSTYYARGFADARGQAVFYLAGPVSFAALAVVCGQITIRWSQLERLLWVLLGPIVAIALITTQATGHLQASDYSATHSNEGATGGFGPNQVSAILSIGAIVCILIVLRDVRIHFRLIAGGIALWMAGQSALTFSRGGLVNLIAALVVIIPALLLHRKIGPRLVVTLTIGVLIVGLLVIPGLERATGGAIEARFQDRQVTGRATLVDVDLEIFRHTLPFGAGIAGADPLHVVGDTTNVASHNEYTRLLAEHGILGILALFALAAMVVGGFLRQPGNLGRAWSGGLAFWGLAELSHSGSRIALGMGVIALAMLRVVDDGVDDVGEDDGAEAALPVSA